MRVTQQLVSVTLLGALALTACGGNTDDSGGSGGNAGAGVSGNAGNAQGGDSGTAGNAQGGVSGNAGSGTAGNGGSAGTAGSGGVPYVTGGPGEPCSPVGGLGCGAVTPALQLVCATTGWQALGTCSGAQVCDPRQGSPTLGACVDKDPVCVGHTDGAPFGSGTDVVACDAAGVGSSVTQACPSGCLDAQCCSASEPPT
jgi:hypothetical protein